jgi:hypothetical protein
MAMHEYLFRPSAESMSFESKLLAPESQNRTPTTCHNQSSTQCPRMDRRYIFVTWQNFRYLLKRSCIVLHSVELSALPVKFYNETLDVRSHCTSSLASAVPPELYM